MSSMNLNKNHKKNILQYLKILKCRLQPLE